MSKYTTAYRTRECIYTITSQGIHRFITPEQLWEKVNQNIRFSGISVMFSLHVVIQALYVYVG